ncbi:MAG: type IV toxin-antitoxin system AbiEi family antitoxin domain-containing protein [Anaerolineae bacterium]
MEFQDLLAIIGDEPLFETGLLLAGPASPEAVRVQLSRWVQSGKLYQLRRGLYVPAPPYQRVAPHPFLVANRLAPGSYVSRESALAHYGLIPEYVAVTTSVGTGRPHTWDTPLGTFDLRHLKRDLLWGYRRQQLAGRQAAFVAVPEKALLDLIYLQSGGDTPAYLSTLRLQNLHVLDLTLLSDLGRRAGSPKLMRAVQVVEQLAQAEGAYEEL